MERERYCTGRCDEIIENGGIRVRGVVRRRRGSGRKVEISKKAISPSAAGGSNNVVGTA